MLFLSEDCLVH